MLRILITGGAGFIGLHLAKRMLAEGHYVIICDNFSRAVKDPDLQQLFDHENCQIVEVDLLDANAVHSLGTEFDLIFHLAAIIGVQHVLVQPYAVLITNVKILENVISLARTQRNIIRLLFASTSEVYAGTQQQFNMKIPTSEDTPLALASLEHPRTSYMLSKLYGEAMCVQSGLPVTIFRPHNVYGPRMGLAHVIPELCKKVYQAKLGDQVEVFSVDHTRTFCYISDAIEQLVRMSRSSDCENKIVNLGTETPETTIGDLANIILSVAGREDLRIKKLPATSGSPARRCPNMEKTYKLINYTSEISLTEGVRKTFDWYSANIFANKGLSSL